VVVLGCSPDSVEKQRKFREKYDLPFALLADPDHAVAGHYGVWQQKSFLGKSYMGVARTTFLIDPAGTVAQVFEKVKPEGHAEQVAGAVERLRGA
jgi:thioredoxin-dependent peroxiredoxin